MTNRILTSAAFVTLALASAVASSAFANAGGYVCQRFSPSKNTPAVAHCITWSHEGAANMRAAHCDPASMGDAVMLAKCQTLMDGHLGDGAQPTSPG